VRSNHIGDLQNSDTLVVNYDVQNRETAIYTDALDPRVFHDALVFVAGSIGIVPSKHLE
jgi:hypothetical protein